MHSQSASSDTTPDSSRGNGGSAGRTLLRRPSQSFAVRVQQTVLGISCLVIVLAIVAFLVYEWYVVRDAMARDLTVLGEVVASNSAAAMLFADRTAGVEVLSSLRAKPHIVGACLEADASQPADVAGVRDEAGVFASYRRDGQSFSCADTTAAPGVSFASNQLLVSVPVSLGNDHLGYLHLAQEMDELWERLVLHFQVAAMVLVFGLALAYVLTRVSGRLLTRGILRLASAAKGVAESRDYSVRLEKEADDEVGALIDNFNTMLEQIGQRDQALETTRGELLREVGERTRANQELEAAITDLQDLQTQLVQTEKLASLGGLVAGVAHEINTPVGISVTAASTLREKAIELRAIYESGSINRSVLDSFVDTAEQSSAIILSNLERSAELIQSFKQVAIDQSSSERREYNLREYIEETLLSLRPKYKHTNHDVRLNCPENIFIDGYPGAVSQILTNLLLNSLVHAFNDGAAGIMSIDVEQRGDRIDLRYRDNGSGMTEDIRKKIFDPFFTTRRGQGGSGLGMHIVHNLVINTLGGRITVDSLPGEGTTIDIDFPRRLERQKREQADG